MRRLEIAEVVKRVIAQVYNDNQFIRSDEVLLLLQTIESTFEIKFDARIYETSKLFINQYPDIGISKHLIIQFLNDLLEIDLIDLVYEQGEDLNGNQSIDNFYSETTSPVKLNSEEVENNDTIALQENHLKELENHINSRISSISEKFSDTSRKKKYSSSFALSTKTLFTTFNSVLFSVITYSNKIITIINIALIIISLGLLTLETLNIKINIFPIVYRLFIYPTSKDIYWWQRIPIAEEKIWVLLDYIRQADRQFIQSSKRF